MRARETPVGTDNGLLFVIDDLPIEQLVCMLMTDTQGFVPLFGSSPGLLCLGDNVLGCSQSVLGTVNVTIDFLSGLTALPQGTTVIAGEGWSPPF